MNPRITGSPRYPTVPTASGAESAAAATPGSVGGETAAPPHRRTHEAPRPASTPNAQVTAYLAARNLDARPVEGRDLQRLQRADKVVQYTRQALKHGRGNVRTDVEVTQHESSRRTAAAQLFCSAELPRALGRPVDVIGDQAAASSSVGAGSCDDFARMAMVAHAAILQPQETLLFTKSPTAGHSWVDVAYDCLPPEQGGDPTRAACRITIDGWAQGSALFHQDRNPGLYASPTVLRARVEQETAADIVQQFRDTMRTIHTPEISPMLAKRVQDMHRRQWTWPDQRVYDPTPAMSPEFAARAQARMAHGPDGTEALRERAAGYGAPVSNSLQPQHDIRTAVDTEGHSLRDHLAAVSAARAMGANVAGATQQAPAILDAVRALPDTPNHPGPVRSR
jgi:hypothetical protein